MKRSIFFLLVILLGLLLSGCTDKATNDQTSPASQSSAQVEVPVPAPAPTPVTPAPATKPGNNPSGSTVNTKTLSWYYIRNNQHQYPAINKDIKELIDQNQAIYLIPNESKRIYLSFDCGYELGYTQRILDTLASKQVKAAFFITGQYIKTQPELVKRMRADGHLVCNHSYNHPDLSTLDQTKLTQEITVLENSYRDLTGFEMDKYLRPPMGNYNANSLKWTKDLGYTTVFWSMAWKDWDPQQQPGADFVYQHVIANIHPGAIILMHAVSQSDTEALDKVITELQAQGYVFSTFNS
jgi:peptidoglycan-N-acetylmuramic acid deacetylase